MPQPAALALLKLAGAAPALAAAGRAAARARLPSVTGFAVAGALLGPAACKLLTRADLAVLHPLDGAALAAVALAAGAELHAADVRRHGRAVIAITLAVALASAGAVAGALTLVPSAARALAGGDAQAIPAATALAAVIAAARSPAAAVAVLRETGGTGPFCSLVMAVVVLKDVLVFAAFAVAIELSAAATGSPLPIALARALGALAVSVAVGTAGGVGLAGALAAWPPPEPRAAGAATRWPAQAAALARAAVPRSADGGVRAAFVLLAAAATAAGAARGGGEPLLAAVAAGAVAANVGSNAASSSLSPSKTRVTDGDEAGHDHAPAAGAHAATRLDAALSATAPAVNLVFFSLAGASLRLGALPATAGSALVVAAARAAGVVAGSAAGAAAARLPRPLARRVWQAMITQAGVALGLARAVDRRFGWGADFAATMASVIVLNLLAGPPLFRAAVVAVGEARAFDDPDATPARRAAQRAGSGLASPTDGGGARPRSPRGGAAMLSPAVVRAPKGGDV